MHSALFMFPVLFMHPQCRVDKRLGTCITHEITQRYRNDVKMRSCQDVKISLRLRKIKSVQN
jgi:hypothetical protein